MSRTMRLMLIHQAERALRYWAGDGISREKAAEELPNWHAFAGLDDEMVADVLGRFPAAEPPSVPGKDWLPGATVLSDAAEVIKVTLSESLGTVLTAAKVNAAAEAVAALDEPKAREYTDREGDLWVDGQHEHIVFLVRMRGNACEPVPYVRDDAEEQFGPLVEVPAPVKELPAAEAEREFCGYDTCTEYAGYGVGRCRAHHDLAVFP